jgi:hypothetical protein
MMQIRMQPMRVLFLLSMVGALWGDGAAAQGKISVLIRTEINPPDPFAGMKSEHRFVVDFQTKTITGEEFKTGVTDLGPVELKSVRDKFVISEKDIQSGKATFKLVGQTASGVTVMPNIDYRFALSINSNGTGTLEGCHDGYPAYTVRVNNKDAYAFKHKAKDLIKLFGTCDQVLALKSF